MDVVSYALSKKYTDDSMEGGGAVKGKNLKMYSWEQRLIIFNSMDMWPMVL